MTLHCPFSLWVGGAGSQRLTLLGPDMRLQQSTLGPIDLQRMTLLGPDTRLQQSTLAPITLQRTPLSLAQPARDILLKLDTLYGVAVVLGLVLPPLDAAMKVMHREVHLTAFPLT